MIGTFFNNKPESATSFSVCKTVSGHSLYAAFAFNVVKTRRAKPIVENNIKLFPEMAGLRLFLF